MKHYGLYGLPPAYSPFSHANITRTMMGRDVLYGLSADDGFGPEEWLPPQYTAYEATRLCAWLGMLYDRCGFPLKFDTTHS